MKNMFSLEACRKNAGLTLRQAASYAGISYQTLSKYENNSADIPISLLNKLVFLYQVDKDLIFLGNKYELIRKIKEKRQKKKAS
ncbi:helix-turn-helix transcriptional regulator [uncultured Limosilactobacillus sp.]|uniref:helix-turn-helix domain-containing protein n=1 Tax=uncultured Limosilactobacillus sp. TaxID=2837629 RepID=UPI0025ED17D8|nr:helix-turn-helix transcriptional regulator [uncultured Limosilactobacillus sp.]